MRVLLASQSPRRRELLAQIVPAAMIEVRPPVDAQEPGFAGLDRWDVIERQLRRITRAKFEDVATQIEGAEFPDLIVAADTIIAVQRDERWTVLGKPPEDGRYEETVRHWLSELLGGSTHLAATGLVVATAEQLIERVVMTRVTFREDVAELVDWYLSTGEPRGKAGAYAIQGAGSVLVSHVAGSLSNVVGLPLEELLNVARELGCDLTAHVSNG